MSATAEARQPWGWRSLALTVALTSCAAVLFAGLFTAFGELGWDFRVAYYPAGEAVLRGESPYPADPTNSQLDEQRVYAYPPQLALLVAPLTLLPVDVAVVLAVVGSLAALVVALALVGVRDLRCYAVVVIWAPGWNALQMAQVSASLALLLALVWRYRDRLLPMALPLGAMVSLKLFLWPVAIWTIATRGIRPTLVAAGAAIALTVLSWAVLGFAGINTYPELLERVATQESYSIKGMASAIGLSAAVAYAITTVVVGALLVLCVALVRQGDEERAFMVAVLAALAVSPIVWLHYLVLLAVPLGVLRPRFSAPWLLPILLWAAPRSGHGDGVEPFLVGLVVVALAALVLARPRQQSHEAHA